MLLALTVDAFENPKNKTFFFFTNCTRAWRRQAPREKAITAINHLPERAVAEGADDGVVGEYVWHDVRLSRLSQQPHRSVGVAKLVTGRDGGVV